ncbi:MAG: YggS family pyridoxal phosphate-dependent enzyme [Paludibacteraceae bacterium]|nr:YggS family pyridoxal phosphate-dependent enzyme [Paludibacteraceae bacterium]
MNIQENINRIRLAIPEHVKLVCVSKFHPVEDILTAYKCGERYFGENRPQELVSKVPELPEDIKWQFIGNLQTNKVKFVVPNAEMIHSVSNERLLEEINKTALKLQKKQKILIELHVAQEETKQGFTTEEAINLFTPSYISKFSNLEFCGVMGMASLTEDKNLIRRDFQSIANTFKILKNNTFNTPSFKEISMGMSHDYEIAIEEGSTIVRIGTSIFGERQYNK